MEDRVIVLGARGSVPVTSSEQTKYGGSTTCILLRLDDQPIVVDAGTGILHLNSFLTEQEKEIPLLLSHPHADHLIGFPMCPTMFDGDFTFHVYAARRGGLDAAAQVSALMSAPLWPIRSEQLPADIRFHTMQGNFRLGPVQVDTMEGSHPGGVTLFRFSTGSHRVVCMTDCALAQMPQEAITYFARDCDLLLCDGQYKKRELQARRDYGHSSWLDAAKLGTACGAKQVRIIHHAPQRTDWELDEAAESLQAIHPNCTFAYDKEEIIL